LSLVKASAQVPDPPDQQARSDQAIDDLYDARLLHVLRRGIVHRDQPGTLYDGFAIDYGCYVALMLDSKLPTPPRQRVGWLNPTHAVPPDGFDFRAEAIDLDALK
jgi:hypothetical protein